jgi:choline dehydrogenase-like flavoprotein
MATSPSAAAENQWDFIVVGGGLAGSVVASRLQSSDSTRKILIVEAGDYANDREDIIWPNSKNLEGGDFDWKDTTISQQHLNGRVLPYPLGKGLGGGTLINQGKIFAYGRY